MASKEVYRIRTAEGYDVDYHGTPAEAQAAHPGADILGRRVVSEVGEGSYVPYRPEPKPAPKPRPSFKPAVVKTEANAAS